MFCHVLQPLTKARNHTCCCKAHNILPWVFALIGGVVHNCHHIVPRTFVLVDIIRRAFVVRHVDSAGSLDEWEYVGVECNVGRTDVL